MDGSPKEIGTLNNILTLPGVHNKQNAAAAYAVAKIYGLSAAQILHAMASYPGLAHRQFTARVINGVAYINDSKATNGDAAARALVCHQNIYWIVGGKPKEGGLKGLEGHMNRIKHAFVIGEAMDEFMKWLEGYNVPATPCKTMDIAVLHAHRMAQEARGQPGGAGVVLLSPACASYDQFQSYAHRGDVFTALVNDLGEQEIAA
jgi:UDP-N-acetylmuramoylalanine--D-glutamate ligase